LRFQPRRQPDDHIVGAGAADGGDDCALVVQSRDVAQAHRVAGSKLEAEKVLKRTRHPRAPLVGGHARERLVVDRDGARGRLVELAEQLDEGALAGAVLADDGM